MAQKVSWALTAYQDLDDAATYIADDSPQGAANIVEEALRKSDSLAEFPERHAVVPELAKESIRETLVFRYRLIYQVARDEVRVVGFIHSAQDFLSAWESRNRPILDI